jgi:hypothetical protein
MKKLRVKLLGLGAVVAAALIGLSPESGAGPHGVRRVLAFNTMYAVDGPFLGATNAIDTMAGDDLPWELTDAHGFLDSSGHLKLQIHGLVFGHDPKVPPELQGTNDEPNFHVVLTCRSEDASENLVLSKVVSKGFPADAQGNCTINTHIELPGTCVAPVLFITGEDDSVWFAATGVESGD